MNLRRTILVGERALDLTFHGDDSLLDVVRRAAGVRSASLACQDGSCGACRVLVGGQIVNACRVPWRDVAPGVRIESYEDLATSPAAVRAVDAFCRERPTRCSLCVGALGVTAVALDRSGKARDPQAVETALTDATCMCTGRGSLRRALLQI
jgi:aldehyde oxidoreductase